MEYPLNQKRLYPGPGTYNDHSMGISNQLITNSVIPSPRIHNFWKGKKRNIDEFYHRNSTII